MASRLNIFLFTDYREYLKAFYDLNKKSDDGYSFRQMAHEMGFTSPNYLKLIIDRDREIGKASVQKVIAGLGLNQKESEYFSYLVYFAKGKTQAEKDYFYGLIANIRAQKVISTIHTDQYSYYDNWYNIIIRELIVGKKKESLDYAALARRVKPAILPKQAKKAVQVLEDLGFITVDSDGCFMYRDPLINTANQVHSFAIKKYHLKMIELAGLALEKMPSEAREISACSVRVSQQGFVTIKRRIQDFREEILQIAQNDTGVDRVAQINMQLFPVSEIGGEGEAGIK